MIVMRMSPDAFGDDPIMGYTEFIDKLLQKHTQHNFESYQQALVTVQYPDGQIRQLDDEVSRYADNELSFYSLEEKIDTSYYYVAMNARNNKGIERIGLILNDITRHDSYRGRDLKLKIIGVVSDEPQCIPCLKKKLERERNKGGV